ncbi:MAG: hypothetical protein FWF01_04025, partial [Alphaproteobacteria bacterium]|nr:hypothetical protein [Alphaproteobacteria bacterium]
RVVESDTPANLLADPKSMFSRFMAAERGAQAVDNGVFNPLPANSNNMPARLAKAGNDGK